MKLFSLGISVFDGYAIYTVFTHLYQYVTTVHKEPDEVMILLSIYGLGLILRCAVGLYGYHFCSTHTDRTLENYKGLFSSLKVITGYTLISTMLLYKFLDHHVESFSFKHASKGGLNPQILSYIYFV